MSKLDTLLEELVTANRILAREEVVDSFGHISARHPDRPDRFFLSRDASLDSRDSLIFDARNRTITRSAAARAERTMTCGGTKPDGSHARMVGRCSTGARAISD